MGLQPPPLPPEMAQCSPLSPPPPFSHLPVPPALLFLAQRGADPSLHSLGAWSPLIVASAAGYLDIIRVSSASPVSLLAGIAASQTSVGRSPRRRRMSPALRLARTTGPPAVD